MCANKQPNQRYETIERKYQHCGSWRFGLCNSNRIELHLNELLILDFIMWSQFTRLVLLCKTVKNDRKVIGRWMNVIGVIDVVGICFPSWLHSFCHLWQISHFSRESQRIALQLANVLNVGSVYRASRHKCTHQSIGWISLFLKRLFLCSAPFHSSIGFVLFHLFDLII